MELKLSIAVWQSVHDAHTGRPMIFSWESLCRQLTHFEEIDDKRHRRLISCTRHRSNPAHRTLSDITELSCLILDMDKGTPFAELHHLRDLSWVTYTSFSHKPKYPKYRVVIPLAFPVPASAWPEFFRAANLWIAGGRADGTSESSNQSYYLASHAPGRKGLSLVHDGRWLNPDDVPVIVKPGASPAAPRVSARRLRRGKGDYRTLDAVAWFQAHGHYIDHIAGNRHAVLCPWHHEHTCSTGKAETVIFQNDNGHWPVFFCRHDHCRDRRIGDVLSLWPDADQFCSATYRSKG